jgi:PAS domain S-box-containing protein
MASKGRKDAPQRPKARKRAAGGDARRAAEDALRRFSVLVEASDGTVGSTERGGADSAVRKSEPRRGTLFESMQEGLAHCRMLFVDGLPQDFVYVAVNAAFESLTGLKDVVGRRVSEVIPGIRESDPQLFEIYGRVASGGAPERFETYVNALQQWFSISVFSPEEEHFVAVFDVITDRKRAEDDLRRSEAAYRGLVEYAPLGIYRSTADGHFLTVNPALIRMLGYGWAEELLRLDIPHDVYVDPRQRAALLAEFAQHDEAGSEMEWRRKDGSLITVRVTVRTIRDPGGRIECYEGLVEDVTQQRSLEAQFRQAQRLEAVGRLAGGVAHDFNNVLTAITGYSDLLLEDLEPGDPKRGDVEEIRAAAQRAAVLTRQLLAFSRKQVLQSRVLDLNAVIRTLDKMLRRVIGEDVKLELALAAELGAVRADPGQIEQVILNLAVNSRDAMPSGGRLTIETANVVLDEAYAREHAAAAPGPYVMLAVSDTGVGMDADVRAHIFEPFFTTKEQGKGTGLGLATVYGIIKQSGGYVWVYSEPGRGAAFKIYLPHVDGPVEAPDATPPERPAAGGRETVLLAEDDPSVREIVAEVLAQKGYRVLRAPDGQTALEMARGQPGELHLLVTDLVMPGMTGRELAEVLRAERPGLRVLYMSGYTDDAVVRHGVLEEGMPYLQKPFPPRALASKVREVLDRPSSEGAAVR